MSTHNEICEICGGRDFWQYKYPLSLKPYAYRTIRGMVRRYIVNISKFFIRILVKILPFILSPEIKKRAQDPYKKLQTFTEARSIISGIARGMKLFEGRQIFICKNCELGIVSPRISEEALINHYQKDYWISGGGEIEKAESPRTIITHKILSENLDLKAIDTTLEFGSASAQMARYLKSKEPKIIFDAIDPGILWKEVLSKELRNIYTDLKEIKSEYALIVSSHALEHVPNLKEYFEKFFNLLKPGGYLYFEVPNSEEKDVIFGSNPDFHFPHTYFFTPKAVNEISKKFKFNVVFNKTFSRSYGERWSGIKKNVLSTEENPKGAYLRVLLKKR